mmetsp:Transcript_409/g.1350  ORF Transcript_409/g.1350 Transcript_409/m.1350 type:complete len:280 (-) Transcript_409:717-1556(-)
MSGASSSWLEVSCPWKRMRRQPIQRGEHGAAGLLSECFASVTKCAFDKSVVFTSMAQLVTKVLMDWVRLVKAAVQTLNAMSWVAGERLLSRRHFKLGRWGLMRFFWKHITCLGVVGPSVFLHYRRHRAGGFCRRSLTSPRYRRLWCDLVCNASPFGLGSGVHQHWPVGSGWSMRFGHLIGATLVFLLYVLRRLVTTCHRKSDFIWWVCFVNRHGRGVFFHTGLLFAPLRLCVLQRFTLGLDRSLTACKALVVDSGGRQDESVASAQIWAALSENQATRS